jgi:hypothetical protein
VYIYVRLHVSSRRILMEFGTKVMLLEVTRIMSFNNPTAVRTCNVTMWHTYINISFNLEEQITFRERSLSFSSEAFVLPSDT